MPKTTFVRKPCTLDDVRTGAAQIEERHGGKALDSYYVAEEIQMEEHAAEYRLEAFGSCPGLTELWTQPFQAKYDAADGAVLIRFRRDANGDLQVAANIMEK